MPRRWCSAAHEGLDRATQWGHRLLSQRSAHRAKNSPPLLCDGMSRAKEEHSSDDPRATPPARPDSRHFHVRPAACIWGGLVASASVSRHETTLMSSHIPSSPRPLVIANTVRSVCSETPRSGAARTRNECAAGTSYLAHSTMTMHGLQTSERQPRPWAGRSSRQSRKLTVKAHGKCRASSSSATGGHFDPQGSCAACLSIPLVHQPRETRRVKGPSGLRGVRGPFCPAAPRLWEGRRAACSHTAQVTS